jgi:hypothetical protein
MKAHLFFTLAVVCLAFGFNTCVAGYTVHIVSPAVNNHMILQEGPLPPVCKEGTLLEIAACRGEYEPASFVVSTTEPLEDVRIEVGAVTGPGEPWPQGAVDIRIVKEIWQSMVGISGVIPSLLVYDDGFVTAKSAPVEVDPDADQVTEQGFAIATAPKPGKNIFNQDMRDADELQPVTISSRKQFWITVQVPDFAYTGDYQARIRLVPANADSIELSLRIQVYSFKLLPPMIEYSIYYPVAIVDDPAKDWRNEGGWSSIGRVTEAQYIAECRNMVAHGVTNPNLYVGVGVKPDGSLDFERLERVLRAREKAGIDRGATVFAMNAAAEPVSKELTPDDIEKRVRIVREVMAWGKANGYPDIRWAAADEAWGDWLLREYGSMKAVKDGGGNVWVATGIQFFDLVGEVLQTPILHSPMNGHLSAAGSQYPPGEVLRHTAEIARAGNHKIMSSMDTYRKCIDSVHRLGYQIFIYMHPAAGIPLPELHRRSEGLSLWRIGFDGTMTWAYIHIQGEPRNQQLHWAKVLRVDGGVIDTLRWEGHREGVDDVRYLTTLNDTLARARGRFPGDDLIRETEEWLAGIDVVDGELDAIRREMARRTIALLDLGYKEMTPEEALATVDHKKVDVFQFAQPWRFRMIPIDGASIQQKPPATCLGLDEKWYDPATSDTQWGTMRTDAATYEKGWGQDTGFGWYRIELPLSAGDAKRKFHYLYFAACDEDTWVYVNGKQVFTHTLRSTGLLPEQIWLMPFVVPLSDVELRGNDLLAVRIMNGEAMGGIWKPVHLVVSDQELNSQQVAAVVEAGVTE